jgi:hypothetical protein
MFMAAPPDAYGRANRAFRSQLIKCTASLRAAVASFFPWKRAEVKAGLYPGKSEVVRERPRLLCRLRPMNSKRPGQLRAGIQIGIDRLDRGERSSGDQVRAEIAERPKRRRDR